MASIDRQTLIDLLNRFNDTDDAAVSAAARAAQQALDDAGLTWDDVLVPDDTSAPADDGINDEMDDDVDEDIDDDDIGDDIVDDDIDDDDIDDDADDDSGDDSGDLAPLTAAEAGADLALIDRILRDLSVSEDTRAELDGYREDIEAGEFTASDRNYLNALRKRLSKK